MIWYYSKNGVQFGPVSEEELLENGKSGEVSATELVWREGQGDWKPFSLVPEFQGIQSALQVPAPMPSGAAAVSQPGYSAGPYTGPEIPNYLWQAITVTVLCCLPFGVVSIVYAAKVDGLKAGGDIVGAQAASKSAKTWAIAAVGGWLAIIAIYVLFLVVLGLSGKLQ